MEKSKNFEKVKHYFLLGLWSAERVKNAVRMGWITQAECDQLLSGS